MGITKSDYKFQGPKLEEAMLDVYKRDNYIHGRYQKGGGFGLDFSSVDYKIENNRWITERANIADLKIEQARLAGKNIDDYAILKEIAREVNEDIKSQKRSGSWLNYLIYLIVPAIVIWLIFF